MQEKIQKINILYLLAYILVPILVCAIGYTLCYFCFHDGGTGAVVTTMVPTIAAIAWWIFGGTTIFKKKTKELEARFNKEGYKRNHTFYGRGKTVVLDLERGMMGLAFFWNPAQTYIIPATRVTRAWVDDGRMGSGFMEGSSRVSFLFTIDSDIKVRVDTFTSNQRFRMDDKHILTAISKADMMVQSIETAKANYKSAKTSDDKSAKSDTKSTKSTDKKSESKSTSKKTDDSKAKK